MAIGEIGHLRPGPLADDPHLNVESLAAGPGIAAAARALLTGQPRHPLIDAGAFRREDAAVAWPRDSERRECSPLSPRAGAASNSHRTDSRRESATQADEDTADLLSRCLGNVEQLTGKMIAQAAARGNRIALAALHQMHVTLGWAIAQMTTLLAPHVVVIGGGVSLIGEELFLEPLRQQVRRFVFPPLADSVKIVPAALDEEVVVYGAIALAAQTE